MKITFPFLLGVAVILGLPPGATSARAAGANEVPRDIIAVQIRKQGFACKNPDSARRDTADSKPDDAAWILKCEGVTYRVQLVPKQAAKVERVSDEQPQSQSTQAP